MAINLNRAYRNQLKTTTTTHSMWWTIWNLDCILVQIISPSFWMNVSHLLTVTIYHKDNCLCYWLFSSSLVSPRIIFFVLFIFICQFHITFTHARAHAHASTHKDTRAHTHTKAQTHAHTCAHARTHLYTHIHTFTHTGEHTQTYIYWYAYHIFKLYGNYCIISGILLYEFHTFTVNMFIDHRAQGSSSSELT